MDNGDSKEIRREMARIRRELNDDVEEVVEHAKELADWRNFVKRHPWLCMAAAAGVGFLLVPRKLNVISPDAETLAKLARQNRLVVEPRPQINKQGGVLAPLINFMAGAALRSLMTSAGNYAGKLWTDDSALGRSPESQTQQLRDHDVDSY